MSQVLIELVKSAFIDFSAESMLIPWIYLSYNEDFAGDINSTSSGKDCSNLASVGNQGGDDPTADKSKKASTSFNSSKMMAGGLGTSTNINKSNVALLNAIDANQYNSGINESGLDIENEFGYASDEDSIFAEFYQKDEEKVIPRMGKKVGHSSDISATKKQVR